MPTLGKYLLFRSIRKLSLLSVIPDERPESKPFLLPYNSSVLTMNGNFYSFGWDLSFDLHLCETFNTQKQHPFGGLIITLTFCNQTRKFTVSANQLKDTICFKNSVSVCKWLKLFLTLCGITCVLFFSTFRTINDN